MHDQRSRLRAGALIAASALALHELRYLVGYGDRAGQAIAEQGHSYLPVAGALAALLLALAGVQMAASLAGLVRGPAGRRPRPSLALTWASSSVALLFVYAGQELTEGVLSPGHPTGLAAVFGHGGVVAVPLAIGLGLLVAVVLRGARRALDAATERPAASMPRQRGTAAVIRLASGPLLTPTSPLAVNLAGRAPPTSS